MFPYGASNDKIKKLNAKLVQSSSLADLSFNICIFEGYITNLKWIRLQNQLENHFVRNKFEHRNSYMLFHRAFNHSSCVKNL